LDINLLFFFLLGVREISFAGEAVAVLVKAPNEFNRLYLFVT
jgi:hypothetical protein